MFLTDLQVLLFFLDERVIRLIFLFYPLLHQPFPLAEIFVNEDGNVIIDPKMDELSKKIFSKIKSTNEEILQNCLENLNQKFKEKTTPLLTKDLLDENEKILLEIETNRLIEEQKELVNIRNDVNEIVEGKDNLLKSRYIEKVCQKTYKK